ncbi:MAG: hypothetical protein U0T73_10850 [Chitinophagales bacterium]
MVKPTFGKLLPNMDFKRFFITVTLFMGVALSGAYAQEIVKPKPKPKPKQEVKVVPPASKMTRTEELRVQREKRALFQQERAARSDGHISQEERSQLRRSRNKMNGHYQHTLRSAGRR